MTNWTPLSPRICSRCALRYDEPWRLACSRCGGVVIPNTDRSTYFRIIDRANRDGWTRDAPDRSNDRAKRWQEKHPPTHQPFAFPLTHSPEED